MRRREAVAVLYEMFNDNNETFDESRAVEAFRNVGNRSPQEIINHLLSEGKKWANGRPQSDDVTFVAIKVKVQPQQEQT